MSEAPEKKESNQACRIPFRWRLFLVGADSKVVAELNPTEGVSPQRFEPVDLADFLFGEGLQLAEVGEFLVQLESATAQAEANMETHGGSSRSMAFRLIAETPNPLGLLVLSDVIETQLPCLSAEILKWGVTEARRLGLIAAETRRFAPLESLVVDANPDRRAYIQALLRKLGCRARGAASGGEALALANCHPFELLLLDSGLRGLGSVAVSDLVAKRSRAHWGYGPFIATVESGSEDEERADPLDNKSLQMPISLDSLRRTAEAARAFRYERVSSPLYLADLPVLELDIWGEEIGLLRRLAKSFVNQGLEFFSELDAASDPLEPRDFEREVYSLKSGADILQAKRFAAVCERVLTELAAAPERFDPDSQEQLSEEFDRFRHFVARRGLLREGDSGRRV